MRLTETKPMNKNQEAPKWCKMKSMIPCEKMQHRLRPVTIHRSSLSYKASSDVQRPTRDIVREIRQFDHVLLARLWKGTVDTGYTTVSDQAISDESQQWTPL